MISEFPVQFMVLCPGSSEPRGPRNCSNPFLYWSEVERLFSFVKENQHASYSQYLTADIIHDEWDSLGVIFFFF